MARLDGGRRGVGHARRRVFRPRGRVGQGPRTDHGGRPDLKTGLANAFAGNGTVLVQLANLLLERNPNGTYANLADADTSISCLDRPWPRSLAAWQAAASAASRAAPLFGAPIVWGSLACAYWLVPSYPLPRIRAAGAPPILVVGTLRDPATPYRWARALAGDLSSGVLLGWNGDGHTANPSQLFVSNAHNGTGLGTVSAYSDGFFGQLSPIGSAPYADGQTAPCWVEISHNGRYLFTVNTGSGNISSYAINRDGSWPSDVTIQRR